MSHPNTPIHRFQMPIGDWSCDGHERCDYYTIESNKPIEAVREAHFNILPKTGIDIERICPNIYDDTIDIETLAKLKTMGFVPSHHFNDETVLSSSDMAHIWVILLMQADPELDLTIVIEEEMDILPFIGYDDKGRHIGNIGYGIVAPAGH